MVGIEKNSFILVSSSSSNKSNSTSGNTTELESLGKNKKHQNPFFIWPEF